MLYTPIRYINNGEPLDQVTLNRKGYDIQQNLEQIINRLTTAEGQISGGSVAEVPDTIALRDQYGTTQFGSPRVGTNPIRLGDSDVAATSGSVARRDSDGTFKLGAPNSPESPIRGQDMVGGAMIFPFNPGSDWIVADGRAVSRTTYAPLFNKIGTTYGNGNGSTTFNVPDYRQLLDVVSISGGSSSGIFGTWNNSFPTSGTAPSDGIIHAKSQYNRNVRIYINGVEVQHNAERDKYGQGPTSISAGVRKGDSYSISGSAYRRFLSVDVSLPEPSKIALPVNYYIRGR